jgi:3-methyladenine DNA glycosylase AlkD
MTFAAFQKQFRLFGRPEKADILQRFFKTGPGQYGEGDRFLGIMVPQTRKMVRVSDFLTEKEVLTFLASPFHEERVLAVLILVRRFERGDEQMKKRIYDVYLRNVKYVNNWDLVDLSAPRIVGAYLEADPQRLNVMKKFATSHHLWTRRIAMLSTFYGIYLGRADEALAICEMLLSDSHDLMHKACGWMLREVGKRCSEKTLRIFLDTHYAQMPRTTLRYAIERFPKEMRDAYLAKR